MRAWGNWLDPIDLKSIALCIPVRVRVPAPKNYASIAQLVSCKRLIIARFLVRVQVEAPNIGDVAEWPKAAGC